MAITIYTTPDGTKYTNVHNLPEEVVRAILKDRYTDHSEDPYDYSSSTLTTPIQLLILKKRHSDKMRVMDVIKYMWSFYGSIAHAVLEETWRSILKEGGREVETAIEERIYMQYRGKVISGKLDCYEKPQIRDYKNTRVFKYMKQNFEDWEKGQNVYAQLCRENKRKVEELKIICFFRDWSEGESYKKGYPPAPVVSIDLPLWDETKALGYIHSRVDQIIEAEAIEDQVRKKFANMPNVTDEEREALIQREADIELWKRFPCSNADMWCDLKDFAVIKPGADRATKTFDTKEEAEAHIIEKGWQATHVVEERWTKRTRCLDWCPASEVCRQHADFMGNNLDGDTPF